MSSFTASSTDWPSPPAGSTRPVHEDTLIGHDPRLPSHPSEPNFVEDTNSVKDSATDSSPSFNSQAGHGVSSSEQTGVSNGATVLPMEPEGFALREWLRDNAKRLEEKERKEKETLKEIKEEAEEYKKEFYRKRQLTIENKKGANREKEKLALANMGKFHKEAEQNYWKAIGELIPREVAVMEKRGKKEEEKKKPSVVVIPGPKPGKPTDMSRMRQILLKLKHNPPPHMRPKPPASTDSKREGKPFAASAAETKKEGKGASADAPISSVVAG